MKRWDGDRKEEVDEPKLYDRSSKWDSIGIGLIIHKIVFYVLDLGKLDFWQQNSKNEHDSIWMQAKKYRIDHYDDQIDKNMRCTGCAPCNNVAPSEACASGVRAVRHALLNAFGALLPGMLFGDLGRFWLIPHNFGYDDKQDIMTDLLTHFIDLHDSQIGNNMRRRGCMPHNKMRTSWSLCVWRKRCAPGARWCIWRQLSL